MRAFALLLLVAALAACGRVGPPVPSRPAPDARALEAPEPEETAPADADEENPA